LPELPELFGEAAEVKCLDSLITKGYNFNQKEKKINYYNMGGIDSSEILTGLLILIIIQVFITLILRELIMWYWKINKRIELQEKTNFLLEQLLASVKPEQPKVVQQQYEQLKSSKNEKLSLNEIYMKYRQNAKE
jgi:hypothetical protein